MPRINLDLDFLTHPKTLSVSPFAQLLFIRSILYSARHLTDGFVPAGAVAYLTHDLFDHTHAPFPDTGELISQLEAVGWWVKSTGGHTIHDYLEYQLSRTTVENYKKHKQLAGQAGGLAKAKQTPSKHPSKRLANPTPIPIPIPIPIPKTNPKNQDHSEETKIPRDVQKRSREAKSSGTWNAYANAYRGRYGVVPERNATGNSLLCQLVDKLGQEKAPGVAAFYLTHPGSYYTLSGHSLTLLVRDAQKLLTESLTGQTITTTQARQADGKEARGQVWHKLIEEAKRKETA
jgi:hypothetical protein